MQKKLIIKKKTNYWIYVIMPQMWQEMQQFTKLACKEYYDIKQYDIIFFLIKKIGFCGIGYVKSEFIQNTKKELIFKNQQINNYMFMCDIFPFTTIKLSTVFNLIINNDKYYNNIVSFRKKIIPNPLLLVQLNKYSGKKLLKYFISTITPNTDLIQDTISDELPNIINCKYLIPILVDICDEFTFYKNIKEQFIYSLQHILNCSKCIITDNNNNGMSILKNNTNGTFEYITKDSELKFLDCYHNCNIYIDDNITIKYIEMNHIYHNCLFITGKINN